MCWTVYQQDQQMSWVYLVCWTVHQQDQQTSWVYLMCRTVHQQDQQAGKLEGGCSPSALAFGLEWWLHSLTSGCARSFWTAQSGEGKHKPMFYLSRMAAFQICREFIVQTQYVLIDTLILQIIHFTKASQIHNNFWSLNMPAYIVAHVLFE